MQQQRQYSLIKFCEGKFPLAFIYLSLDIVYKKKIVHMRQRDSSMYSTYGSIFALYGLINSIYQI